MNIKKELQKTAKNSIVLTIGGAAVEAVGSTRFGGKPDVPSDFLWDSYEGECGDVVKNRPLSFIAQFDLEEISKFDTENLLPKTGVLSFFYESESQRWGYDPKDKGCARVYWFPDKNKLHTAEFPNDLSENLRFPALKISARSKKSYQSYEDFLLQREKLIEDWEEFDEAAESLGIEEVDDIEGRSKLLGWADPIQENMTKECELVRRGYYLGGDWEPHVTPQDEQEAEQWANRDWQLLFQLSSFDTEDGFELMFGDLGRIYFYIRREELEKRDFSSAWLILQCS